MTEADANKLFDLMERLSELAVVLDGDSESSEAWHALNEKRDLRRQLIALMTRRDDADCYGGGGAGGITAP